jgi:tripartite-type tricarboxylate transporter receptor subunit TctC
MMLCTSFAAIVAIAAALHTRHAQAAQPYPAKPIRMVTAATPGSGPEVIARQLAGKLSEAWGQQVVVDSRPGATGLIGADIVAKSAPDGYTIWFVTSTQLLGTTLYQRHWLAKEFAPIGMLSSTAFGIAVNASLPVNTLAELITYTRARPKKLLYGSNGQGATTHVCMELFNSLAGIAMVHVPYKGGTPALTDLAGGQIHVSCQPLPSLPQFVKAGRVRTLGVTTARRTKIAPDVPPVAETLPGYEILGWHGLLAPLNTPKAIIDKVNAAATKIVLGVDMQERLLALGTEPAPSTPAEFAAWLRTETAKWAKVLKDANIRPTE